MTLAGALLPHLLFFSGGFVFVDSFLRVCQPMGCSPIVLRARLVGAHIHGVPPIVLLACSLALYEALPYCFASLLAHGVLPNSLSAGDRVPPIVLIAGAVRGALPGAPQLLRRRARSWERFPIGFLQCLRARSNTFFCCWYRGLPLLPGNDVYRAWGARPV